MTSPSRTRPYVEWLAAVACLSCLLPFTGKAFHIDEPLFLWSAWQIQNHPADPFGFDVNWDLSHSAKPMWQVTQNPPLTCYYAAIAASIFGWSEIALHIAFLPPALGVVLGTCCLARRFAAPPFFVALITLVSPAFLIIGSSVTSDMPLLCLWIWAIICWDSGLREGRTGLLYATGLLIATATLTKYFGVSLLPLCAVYAFVVARQDWRRWLPALAVPAAAAVAYELWMYLKYGHGHLIGAAAYAVDFGPGTLELLGQRALTALSFFGGCNAFALFVLPWVSSWRRLLLLGVVFSLVVASGSRPWWLKVQLGLWSAVGAEVLILALLECWQRRDSYRLLIAFWIGGTFVFTGFVNHSVNGRSVLPAAPAIAMLLASRIGHRVDTARRLASLKYWLLAPAAALAFVIADADRRMADVIRTAVAQIVADHHRPGDRLWFHGHWGWQYYLELASGQPWDMTRSQAYVGDLMAFDWNNDFSFSPPADRIEWVATYELPACTWATAMNPSVDAGFYSHSRGSLPFVFGPVPPERFDVARVNKAFGPGD